MAERQAQAMAASGTMSHEVAGAFSSRLAASGIKSAAGENLGEGYMSFDEAFSGWRSSAGHDANLLMPGATRSALRSPRIRAPVMEPIGQWWWRRNSPRRRRLALGWHLSPCPSSPTDAERHRSVLR